MGCKILTKEELVGRLERLWAETAYFPTHFLSKEDLTPFLQADQVWCWEATEIPAEEVPDRLRQDLGELRQKEGRGIGRSLLCLWVSTAHNLETLEWAIGAISLELEVEGLLFDILLREDLEETKLGLLLLVTRHDQSVQKEMPHHSSMALPLPLGWDQSGRVVEGDLEKLRHLLVAGRTSTGIGEYIDSLLRSLLHQDGDQEIRMLLIPSPGGKLLRHAGDPHLLLPTITDTREAVYALQKAVMELEQRRRLFSIAGVKDIQAYNALADTATIPAILVVLEELAGLMNTAANETEEVICQIAQQGHTAGIHLILATKCPDPAVITGFIKLYVPSRISFAVDSAMESRITIDTSGAEHLGEEELLYRPLGVGKPIRLKIEQRHCSGR